MKNLTRRNFVKTSTGVTAAFVVLGGRAALAANDKIVVGCMGLGGRGSGLLAKFAARPDVEIAWLSDPDSRRLAAAVAIVEKAQKPKPKTASDFRKVLDDPAVNVLVNATPDHWHALGAILACQAGKDVYVEKPMSHNLWEGRKLIEAARKYQRVVQLGTQSRSAPYVQSALAAIRAGKLGDIHLVRVLNMMQHSMVKAGPEQPVPAGLDYELWCGPAAKLPYNISRSWLNYAEFSCGPIPGDAVHQLDLARYLMGDPPHPKSVSHQGGIYSLKDGRDLPDTQIATYDYGQFTLHFEGALWTPYMKKTPFEIRDQDIFPDWPFCATKIELFGTRSFMCLERHGGGWLLYDENCKVIQQSHGRQADAEHIENFLACTRTRRPPIADVEQGHLSTSLCHLANCAWRAGNRTLVFDAKTETFPATPEANQYLKRAAYRAPWVVPEKV